MPKTINKPKKDGEFSLAVGQRVSFGWGDDLVYAGMPTDKVYSLAPFLMGGAHGWAYDLYFPLDQREIEVEGHRLEVKEVTPREIRLKYLG